MTACFGCGGRSMRLGGSTRRTNIDRQIRRRRICGGCLLLLVDHGAGHLVPGDRGSTKGKRKGSEEEGRAREMGRGERGGKDGKVGVGRGFWVEHGKADSLKVVPVF